MPNMLDDGFLDQAVFVRQVSLLPGNSDYALQNAVSNGIGNAAVAGQFTATINISAYATTLVQLMVERLVNMGYNTPTLTSTTITVSWL